MLTSTYFAVNRDMVAVNTPNKHLLGNLPTTASKETAMVVDYVLLRVRTSIFYKKKRLQSYSASTKDHGILSFTVEINAKA